MRDIAAVLRGPLAAHVLVTCALLLGYLSVLSAMFPFADDPLIDATRALEGLYIRLEPHDPILARLMVDVAIDEEFMAATGADWELEAREMIDAANRLLGRLGIAVEVGSIQRWRSDDGTNNAPALLTDASEQFSRHSGHALLALTGQAAKPLDGWSSESRTSAIATYYRYDKAMTAALVAHEVGHMLGATHHEDGHICQNGACIMNKAGFARANSWCDEHADQIWESIVSGLSVGAA